MTQKGFDALPFFRWLTLSGYFGLMAGFYLWHLWLHPLEKHLVSIVLLLQIGPLMFPLKGLLQGKAYTHAWSMYLAIFYFVVGVWYAGADTQFRFGLYIIFTSLTFFTGAMFYARLAGRRQKQLAAQAAAQNDMPDSQ